MGSQAVLAPSEFRFLQPLERRVEKLHGGGDVGKSNMEDGLLSSPACGLHRQVSVAAGGSLDQVWREIHRPNFQTTQAAAVEDFLAQTGAGQREDDEEEEEEDGLNRGGNNGSMTIFAMDSVLAGQNPQHPEWLQFHHPHQQFGELSAQANSNNDLPVMAASSGSEPPVWKKRGCESITDHTVERRQKRMIKNRESAARSRARRQAYTNELEIEVNKLLEENAKLRKEQAAASLLHSVQPGQTKHPLRRTTSSPF